MGWALLAFVAAGCGGASDVGPADAGVPPDAGPPPPSSCDDGNPCTVDIVAGGGCRFDPVADGTPCEDGDLCTLGDRCRSGQCVAGGRAEGALSLLGRLDTLVGKHLPMGPGRFVTVTRDDLLRGRVQLVARTAGGLSRLA